MSKINVMFYYLIIINHKGDVPDTVIECRNFIIIILIEKLPWLEGYKLKIKFDKLNSLVQMALRTT